MDKQALAQGLKLKSDKAIQAWAKSAETFMGIKADKAIEILSQEKARLAKVEIVAKLSADLAKVKVPANLAKLAKANPDVRIVVTLEGDSATFGIASARKTSTRKTGEGISPTSRKSAWVACQEGIKKGDTFKVEKAEKGYKVNGRFVPSRQNGGLAAYIVKALPDTHAAEILRRYGTTA